MEEDTRVDIKGTGDDRHGEALIYDLSKFLTTLSLLALGGVLTIVDGADKTDIKLGNVIMITGALALAATVAASTATAIAHSRYTGKPITAALDRYVGVTMALLGMGLGMFIFMTIDKLN